MVTPANDMESGEAPPSPWIHVLFPFTGVWSMEVSSLGFEYHVLWLSVCSHAQRTLLCSRQSSLMSLLGCITDTSILASTKLSSWSCPYICSSVVFLTSDTDTSTSYQKPTSHPWFSPLSPIDCASQIYPESTPSAFLHLHCHHPGLNHDHFLPVWQS